MLRLALVLLAVAASGCDVADLLAEPAPTPEAEPWQDMLTAVNAVRAEARTCGGEHLPAATPLAWSGRLEKAADAHSVDMATHDYFSHVGTDGSRVGERVSRTGYDWRRVGENIGWAQRSVDEVVKAWVASPSHCRALMDPGYTEMGASEEDLYWTQVFGRPR